MWVKAYSRLTENGLVTTERLTGTTSTVAEAELAGGDGLSVPGPGPRLSRGEPSPIGGVLEAGGEFAVVTVNSPVDRMIATGRAMGGGGGGGSIELG